MSGWSVWFALLVGLLALALLAYFDVESCRDCLVAHGRSLARAGVHVAEMAEMAAFGVGQSAKGKAAIEGCRVAGNEEEE